MQQKGKADSYKMTSWVRLILLLFLVSRRDKVLESDCWIGVLR